MSLKGKKASEKKEIIKNTLDTYKKTVDTLSKERDHYKQGFEIYREQAKQWKAKYLTLQLSIT